ncbi:MAG: YwaF family protein [Clostridia bacterium]|nr:YwaF family protein [Clostridia bacterium]
MIKLIENFFTHKDFLGGLDLPGRLFSPLHIIFSACLLAAVIILAVIVSKRSEDSRRRILMALWIFFVVFEVVKTAYESLCGSVPRFEIAGILPLYPCSVYLYSMPFCFSKKRAARLAACGYLFTVGFLGAAINFVYPVNVLSNYSCISFMGFHTLSFHGTMLFSMLVMLFSGYHRYNSITRLGELILPALPMLIVSIPANILNFSPIGSDYMFFKANSFFLPAIFGGLSDSVTTLLAYLLYAILPGLFYLPGYIINAKGKRQNTK